MVSKHTFLAYAAVFIAFCQLSLFTADAVQALGAIVDIQWLRIERVEKGSFCTAQGVIQQLGETTVAVATCVSSLQLPYRLTSFKPL